MNPATAHRFVGPNRTAAAWIVGGVMWAIAGLVRGGTEEPIWIAADITLLAALVGLRSQRLERSTLGTAGFATATFGRIAFIAAEILAAAQDKDDNALLPIAALLTVIGMLLIGIAVIRVHANGRLARHAPLAMGIYPLAVMFPYVAAHDGHASNAAITWWALPTIAIAATAHQALRTRERTELPPTSNNQTNPAA